MLALSAYRIREVRSNLFGWRPIPCALRLEPGVLNLAPRASHLTPHASRLAPTIEDSHRV